MVRAEADGPIAASTHEKCVLVRRRTVKVGECDEGGVVGSFPFCTVQSDRYLTYLLFISHSSDSHSMGVEKEKV